MIWDAITALAKLAIKLIPDPKPRREGPTPDQSANARRSAAEGEAARVASQNTGQMMRALQRARAVYENLTPEQRAEHDFEQRVSWVYNNAKLLHNPITREQAEIFVRQHYEKKR
jgi:hypothetical protein